MPRKAKVSANALIFSKTKLSSQKTERPSSSNEIKIELREYLGEKESSARSLEGFPIFSNSNDNDDACILPQDETVEILPQKAFGKPSKPSLRRADADISIFIPGHVNCGEMLVPKAISSENCVPESDEELQNFNEVDFRVLCDHFGHTLPVHNRWYRMRTSTVELTKVAKILIEDFNGNNETAHAEFRTNETVDKEDDDLAAIDGNEFIAVTKPSKQRSNQERGRVSRQITYGCAVLEISTQILHCEKLRLKK